MNCSKLIHRTNGARYSRVVVLTALLALGTAMLAPVATAQIASNQLESIDVATMPGDRVQLRLRMSGIAPEPLTFTIDDPARIALDLPDTGIAMAQRRQEVGVGAVRNVTSAQAQGRTRVVINLSSLVEYSIRTEGNDIYVTLGAGVSSVAASRSQFGPTSSRTAGSERLDSGKRIDDVDFRRGDRGEGRIFVRLSDPRTRVNVRQIEGKIVVEFDDTTLPDRLVKRFDVLDFATPVKTIDAIRDVRGSRLEITAVGDYEQLAYQSDNQFTIEFRPISPDEEEAARRLKVYTGDRLTLNFQDIDTRAVLQIIADFTGMNIVVSDTVTGSVTLRLQNVPWDQALDIILRTKGLDMRQNGNVILVAPAAEIAEQERLALESQQQVQELAPLRSEFIQVNYAKASELAALISSGETSLLSERGSVTIDARTNTLLVQDTDQSLTDIRRLVRTLDVAVRQVLIEARIVIANNDFSRDLGVRFGVTGVKENGRDGLIGVSGSTAATNTLVQGGLVNVAAGPGTPTNPAGGVPPPGIAFPGHIANVGAPGVPQRLNVNLPVSSPAGTIALAILDSNYLVDLELSALQAEGRGEVVSSPRVVTSNQREASITSGVEIPYQEASSSGATTTSFKDAVLELTVTPQITPDDRIIMDLIVKKDSVGANVPSATGGFVPSIDTRSITTQVLVNNGDTVVLGGIYETTQNESVSKVPFLGDIPFIGALFRNKSVTSDKAELLIFITPKILKEGLSMN
ncbi:MAG: type IV pilus secretin PilQ [Gammaproteobacteria bacterium]